MSLSAQEIADLKKRCSDAHQYGRKIALAEFVARELGYNGEAPPLKVVKFSAAHLLHLIAKVEVSGTLPEPAPAKKPTKEEKKEKKEKAAAAPPPPPPPPPPPASEALPPSPEEKVESKDEALEEAIKALDDMGPPPGDT